jgi:hypothetical protein
MKMTVRELKQMLSGMPNDAPVLVLDSEYGGEYYVGTAWRDEVYIGIDNDDNIAFKADVFDCEDAGEFTIDVPDGAKKSEILVMEAIINE